MEIHELFEKARKDTVIHRRRRNKLYTFGATRLPYVIAAESAINQGSVIVRTGEVVADKPSIIMPGMGAQFDGFEELCREAGIAQDDMKVYLMTRMVKMPNLQYTNSQRSMDVMSGHLDDILERKIKDLDKDSDTRTAVLSGPEDTTAMSLLMYVSEMVSESAESNFDEYMERMRRQG